MVFDEIVSYIEGIPKFTEKHSLAHTRRFLELLGNPDRDYASVHVAGTNGKGSVCAFLASICREAGLTVGMFTSPHLSDIRERIEINGEMISEEAFAEVFFRVRGAAEALADEGFSHPSYFEFLYLMACCFFAERKPDLVLVETGLGGRLDATNTLERPLATVITSVSLDHMQYLGTTVPEIAAEKAGILKSGVPAIAWCEDPEAAAVIERRAREVGAPLFRVTREDIGNTQGQSLCVPCDSANGELFLNNASGIDFSVRSGYDSRQIRLWVPGAALFQMENAALAVRTAEVLWRERKLSHKGVSGEDQGMERIGEFTTEEVRRFDAILRAGIGQMRWPCRMEEILPDVYLDGAHNEDGIQRFAESMERVLERTVGVFGNPSGGTYAAAMIEMRERTVGGFGNPGDGTCAAAMTERSERLAGQSGKHGRERRRFVLLFGAVNDKNYGAMIKRLASLKPVCVLATEVPGSRKADAEKFAEAFAKNGVKNVKVIKDAKEAYAEAIKEKLDGVVGICGSLYLAAAIREVEHDQLRGRTEEI